MPIHLLPITRRRFLARTVAAGAAMVVPRAVLAGGEATAGENTFALISDPHIPADPAKKNFGADMTGNLKRVVGEVLACKPPPAAVIFNGDLAFMKGLKGDYANFASVVAPLLKAKMPVHLCVGNHDDRDVLAATVKSIRPPAELVAGRRVAIIESPLVNWFLLDSLEKVGGVPGELGRAQLDWLAKALDARGDKPAVVMTHHPPKVAKADPTALKDTDALRELLEARRHVKAHVFGHRHRWGQAEKQGIHEIDIPATGYAFLKLQPKGWVLATVGDKGMVLELRSLDASHKAHGQKFDLTWRA